MQDAPTKAVTSMTYLFTTLLDGRNANLSDGVHLVLNREPRDFSEYAAYAAQNGAWKE